MHRTYFPEGCLKFPNGKEIEIVGILKLLGVKIDRNLTFESFVNDKRRQGFHNLWQLKRLEATRISRAHMAAAYNMHVRSKIEYGFMSAFHLLTQSQKDRIESVQKRATRTLLSVKKRYGPDVPSYWDRLGQLEMLSLQDRTRFRFNDFAERAEFDPRFASDFVPSRNHHSMRTRAPYYYEQEQFNTNYREFSPVLQMVWHVNTLTSTPEERFQRLHRPQV